MYWNVVPEFIATILLTVIYLNFQSTRAHLSSRDKLLRFTLLYAIGCLVLNIISVIAFEYLGLFPVWTFTLLNTAFFIFYPLITPLFVYYLLLYAFEKAPESHNFRLNIYRSLLVGITLFYFIILVFNPKHGWIFSVDSSYEYHRGVANSLPLIIALIYIVCGVIGVFGERRYLPKTFIKVLLWFPPLTLSIIVIQILFPEIILTGSTFTIAILTVYLNLQTQKISIDNLTKHPNREGFIITIEALIRSKKKANIVVVSLNNFKHINDTYGQKWGDKFLQEIALFLQQIDPKENRVFRYGGDQFAIIFTSDENVMVETITNRFNNRWQVNGISARLNASLALLQLPFTLGLGADPVTLIDHTLRRAKGRGRGEVIRCDTMVLDDIRRKNRLSELLNSAIEENYFSLVFQPIFSLSTHKMEIAEALLRFNTKEYGEIAPTEFIPLAEELGIINQVSQWVIEQVALLLQRFEQEGYSLPTISVNISSKQFSQSELIPDILNIVKSYNIPPGSIVLEITESSFIGLTFQQTKTIMEKLISNGISFHADDFGTGYSNIAYIVNLPFQSVKIDKSLLEEIEEQKKIFQFIEGFIKLVKNMGLNTIIEGVENQHQLRLIKEAGADFAQGFHLQTPLLYDEFVSQYKEGITCTTLETGV